MELAIRKIRRREECLFASATRNLTDSFDRNRRVEA
jgi:hypothetical protein